MDILLLQQIVIIRGNKCQDGIKSSVERKIERELKIKGGGQQYNQQHERGQRKKVESLRIGKKKKKRASKIEKKRKDGFGEVVSPWKGGNGQWLKTLVMATMLKFKKFKHEQNMDLVMFYDIHTHTYLCMYL